jgi:hypothetical protein
VEKPPEWADRPAAMLGWAPAQLSEAKFMRLPVLGKSRRPWPLSHAARKCQAPEKR